MGRGRYCAKGKREKTLSLTFNPIARFWTGCCVSVPCPTLAECGQTVAVIGAVEAGVEEDEGLIQHTLIDGKEDT